MEMETKFLRLRTEVEWGSLFGDWSVCWLGGWAKHRMYFLVMLIRIKRQVREETTPPAVVGPPPSVMRKGRVTKARLPKIAK
jgi:hypothetical protein